MGMRTPDGKSTIRNRRSNRLFEIDEIVDFFFILTKSSISSLRSRGNLIDIENEWNSMTNRGSFFFVCRRLTPFYVASDRFYVASTRPSDAWSNVVDVTLLPMLPPPPYRIYKCIFSIYLYICSKIGVTGVTSKHSTSKIVSKNNKFDLLPLPLVRGNNQGNRSPPQG